MEKRALSSFQPPLARGTGDGSGLTRENVTFIPAPRPAGQRPPSPARAHVRSRLSSASVLPCLSGEARARPSDFLYELHLLESSFQLKVVLAAVCRLTPPALVNKVERVVRGHVFKGQMLLL